MTAVAFHTGVADKVPYACRLVRKARQQELTAWVTGPLEVLTRLDESLWVDVPADFLAHCLVDRAQPNWGVLRRTPVWLSEGGVDPQAGVGLPSVWIHLGGEPDLQPEQFAKVIEVVGEDSQERQAARQRWRAYESRGLSPAHHPVTGA